MLFGAFNSGRQGHALGAPETDYFFKRYNNFSFDYAIKWYKDLTFFFAEGPPPKLARYCLDKIDYSFTVIPIHLIHLVMH